MLLAVDEHAKEIEQSGALKRAVAFQIGRRRRHERFTSSGRPTNSRRTERYAAAAPEMCGAAMLVPLSSMYWIGGVLPRARPWTVTPRKHAFSRRDEVGLGPAVARWAFRGDDDTPSVWHVPKHDPTVIARSALPGSLMLIAMPVGDRRRAAVAGSPELPAATTTTTPTGPGDRRLAQIDVRRTLPTRLEGSRR